MKIAWVDDSEDDPPGYVLRHIHADGQFESIALNAFSAMQRTWWGELQNLGFSFSGRAASFAWYQRHIAEMFGN